MSQKLNSLYDVEWHSIRHAYGAADDVPEMILGITSNDPEQREICLDRLSNTVNHQGSIYEATSYVIPYLIEIVSDNLIPEKDEVLAVLSGFLHSANIKNKRSVEWGTKIIQRLLGYRDLFKQLLDDPNDSVRKVAAMLLCDFEDNINQHATWVRERILIEPDLQLKAHLCNALAEMAERFEHNELTDFLEFSISVLDKIVFQTEHPVARFVAASHLVDIYKQEVSDAILDVIVDTMSNPDLLLLVDPSWGTTFNTIFAIEWHVDQTRAVDVLERILYQLSDPELIWYIGSAILRSAFPIYVQVYSLSPPQKKALTALLSFPQFTGSENRLAFSRHGLPETHAELEALLAVD